MEKNTNYKPVIRIFAAGTPGYRVGWFRLANGENALIVARGSKALVIRLKEDYIIILAPENFNNFIKEFNKEAYPVEMSK